MTENNEHDKSVAKDTGIKIIIIIITHQTTEVIQCTLFNWKKVYLLVLSFRRHILTAICNVCITCKIKQVYKTKMYDTCTYMLT